MTTRLESTELWCPGTRDNDVWCAAQELQQVLKLNDKSYKESVCLKFHEWHFCAALCSTRTCLLVLPKWKMTILDFISLVTHIATPLQLWHMHWTLNIDHCFCELAGSAELRKKPWILFARPERPTLTGERLRLPSTSVWKVTITFSKVVFQFNVNRGIQLRSISTIKKCLLRSADRGGGGMSHADRFHGLVTDTERSELQPNLHCTRGGSS